MTSGSAAPQNTAEEAAIEPTCSQSSRPNERPSQVFLYRWYILIHEAERPHFRFISVRTQRQIIRHASTADKGTHTQTKETRLPPTVSNTTRKRFPIFATNESHSMTITPITPLLIVYFLSLPAHKPTVEREACSQHKISNKKSPLLVRTQLRSECNVIKLLHLRYCCMHVGLHGFDYFANVKHNSPPAFLSISAILKRKSSAAAQDQRQK